LAATSKANAAGIGQLAAHITTATIAPANTPIAHIGIHDFPQLAASFNLIHSRRCQSQTIASHLIQRIASVRVLKP